MPAVDELLTERIDEAEPLIFRNLYSTPGQEEAVAKEFVVQTPHPDHEVSLRAAYEQGHKEGSAAAQQELTARMCQERESIRRSLQQIEREKQRYFAAVEAEVVRLALAIAERVLHREAGMDPTLLLGVARIALEQIADTSETVLHVPCGEEEQWTEIIAAKNLTIAVDDTLPPGEVVLKNRNGTIEFGIRAQLREIERSFFDLLSRRPEARAQ
jgi:flagellar assembly protein FliH